MRLTAAIVLIVVAAGCGSTPGPSGTPSAAVSTFDSEVMTFEYPGNWNPEPGGRRRLAAVLNNRHKVDLKVEPILITSEKETYLPVSVASNLVYV